MEHNPGGNAAMLPGMQPAGMGAQVVGRFPLEFGAELIAAFVLWANGWRFVCSLAS